MFSDAVFIHIGLPKTGTTHLQNLLWHNRHRLAETGMLYPGRNQRAHWAAAMDLMGSQQPDVPGAWPALLEQVRAWDGPVLISHEILAGLPEDRVSAMVQDLAPREVHVIVTLRDFSRIVPASWQERAKNRYVEPWDRFLEQVCEGPSGGHRFWRLQDAPGILTRWSKEAPADHLHVVTVPPLGGDRDLLLRRFAEVAGFDPGILTTPPPKANESLGAVEVALLQQVNRSAKGSMDWLRYRRLVKHYLVPEMLASRSGQLRVVLPESSRTWVQDETMRINEAVRSLGCNVVGDLDELAPTAFGATEGTSTSAPGDVARGDVLRASGDVILDLLGEVERLRGEVRTARRRARRHLRAGPVGSTDGTGEQRFERVRHAVVERSHRNRALAGALRVWRRLRDRRASASQRV